jgi:hypothetical protein
VLIDLRLQFSHALLYASDVRLHRVRISCLACVVTSRGLRQEAAGGAISIVAYCKLVGGGSIDSVDCVVCLVSMDVSQMRGIYMEWWTD